MRPLTLETPALKALWDATGGETPFPEVWRALEVKGEVGAATDKLGRAAYGLFRYLHQRRGEGAPIFTLAPAPAGQIDAFSASLGVVALDELPRLAGIQGYNLGEATLLRLVAFDAFFAVQRDHRWPTLKAGSSRRPPGHIATLLHARDQVQYELGLEDPEQVVRQLLSEVIAQPPDPRLLPRPWRNVAREQLREHVSDDRLWIGVDRWRQERDQEYAAALRTLVFETEARVVAELAANRGYAGYGPQVVPVITQEFVALPMTLALRLWEGHNPPRFVVSRHVQWAPQDDLYQLQAGEGGGSQVIAGGAYEWLTQADHTEQALFDEMVRSPQLREVWRAYHRLAEERVKLLVRLEGITEDRLRSSRCWGCEPVAK